MSFWDTSSGESAAENVEKEYDNSGNDFPVIPDKTNCLALINSAGWDKDRDGNRYIKLRWDVIKPDAVAKSVIFQKLWVKDANPQWKDGEADKKRDKALRMFASIDANAGGKLARAGREPDDDDLALALTNKQMMIKVMVWEIDGKEGNWIGAVGAKGGAMSVTEMEEAPRPKARKPETKKPFDDDWDDEVPF